MPAFPRNEIIPGWNNEINAAFYAKSSASFLERSARDAGMNEWPDLVLLWPLLQNARRLIEVGAGDGRVLAFLKKKSFAGEVIAVERDRRLAALLERRYGSRIRLVALPIQEATFEEVDVVLFQWSVFIEFSPREQQALLKRVFSWLKPDGFIVIDIPQMRGVLKEATVRGRWIDYQSSFGRLQAYVPFLHDMRVALRACASLRIIDYRTSKTIPRRMYLLRRISDYPSTRSL